MEMTTTSVECAQLAQISGEINFQVECISRQYGRPGLFNIERNENYSLTEQAQYRPSIEIYYLSFDNDTGDWHYHVLCPSRVRSVNVMSQNTELFRVIAEHHQRPPTIAPLELPDASLALDSFNRFIQILDERRQYE